MLLSKSLGMTKRVLSFVPEKKFFRKLFEFSLMALAASAVTLVLLFVIAQSVKALSLENEEELIFVSVVFRHGNRAPLVHYKNDPHKDSFPDGPAQLTRTGKINMYQKGRVLRKLYEGFISNSYKENELYCTSTNVDRTLMTAQLVTAAMFRPKDSSHQFEDDLPWLPTPVHEDSPDKSFIFKRSYLCPRYTEVCKEQINQTSMLLKENTKALLAYCEKYCGEKLKNLKDLGLIVDALKTEVADGLELPDWATGIYDPALLELLDILMNVVVKTTEQKRLIIGPLLKQIIDNMVNKSKNQLTPDRKMFLYSGHDFTILGLLSSMLQTEDLIPQPDFGSSLAFELYKDTTNGHTVKVKYLKSFLDEDSEEIVIPDCGKPCTIEKFQETLKYAIPVDWKEECHLESTESIGHSMRISQP